MVFQSDSSSPTDSESTQSHNTVMGRRVVLGEVVTKVSAVGFPINEKLALPGAVLDPIEAHIFCLVVPLAKPSVVELSNPDF